MKTLHSYVSLEDLNKKLLEFLNTTESKCNWTYRTYKIEEGPKMGHTLFEVFIGGLK